MEILDSSQQLRIMIREMGITQNCFAKQLGVSDRMLTNYLSGKKYQAPRKVMLAASAIYDNWVRQQVMKGNIKQ